MHMHSIVGSVLEERILSSLSLSRLYHACTGNLNHASYAENRISWKKILFNIMFLLPSKPSFQSVQDTGFRFPGFQRAYATYLSGDVHTPKLCSHPSFLQTGHIRVHLGLVHTQIHLAKVRANLAVSSRIERACG